MTNTAETAALKLLHENASGFFDRIFNEFETSMQCKAGCARCCYVDLSVFESEAARIVEWASGLQENERSVLKEHLERSGGSQTREAFDGQQRRPCAFLGQDGMCAVYEARPTICRTQGAPLQLKTKKSETESEISVDACPLNFTEAGSLPAKEKWLDLDRLNLLLTLAENSYQKAKTSKALEELKNKQGRIALSKLKKFLLETVLV